MAAAALVRGGESLYLVLSGGRVARFGAPRETDIPPGESGYLPVRLPPSLVAQVKRLAGEGRVLVDDPQLLERFVEAGVPADLGEVGAMRAAREAIPRPSVEELRRVLLERGRRDLARALSSPVEVLIALAREEERLERAAHRELAAQEELLSGSSDALRRFAESGERLKADLTRHLSLLREELEAAARDVVPNLSELLGASLAARLVAAAGGPARLGSMSASRLQLLGTRRRPSPTRGPRYGVIYRAPRMGDVPIGRRAAYARSLAALAVIAARADAFTHRSIAANLVARRDRRVSALRRTA